MYSDTLVDPENLYYVLTFVMSVARRQGELVNLTGRKHIIATRYCGGWNMQCFHHSVMSGTCSSFNLHGC